MIESKSFKSYLGKALVVSMLLVLTALCLLPMVHTIALSLSSRDAVVSGKVTLWPVDATWVAYVRILEDKQFIQSFGVSVLRVILGVTVNMVMTITLAFPLAHNKDKFPQRNIYMWYIVFTMMFSGGMIPSYLVIKNVGLLDSIWALVLPGAVPIFNVLVLMNYFRGLPKEIEEAALIDGCGVWRMMLKIFLPLAIPSLATVGLFAVVNHWNAFFDGAIYINSAAKKPLQTYLQSLVVTEESLQNMTPEQRARFEELTGRNFNSAKMLVSMIPILVVYPFLQRFFVTGLVLGSVKS